MQDGRKAAWSTPYVSVAFFPSLKQNFIAYRSCWSLKITKNTTEKKFVVFIVNVSLLIAKPETGF